MTIANRINELLPRWLGKPFHIGRIDCIQLLWALYPNLPRNHDGMNEASYVHFWRQDKEKTLRVLEDYIMDKFEIVPNEDKRAGDLIVLSTDEATIHGIWLDKGNKMIAVLEQKGCLPIPLFTEDYITLRIKAVIQHRDLSCFPERKVYDKEK